MTEKAIDGLVKEVCETCKTLKELFKIHDEAIALMSCTIEKQNKAMALLIREREKMTKIPNAAMPVVEVIRRDVPRPKDLPAFRGHQTLRWRKAVRKRWKKTSYLGLNTSYCPMGLHRKAGNSAPTSRSGFLVDKLTTKEIIAFAVWWDYQTNPQEAVDAVWGVK